MTASIHSSDHLPWPRYWSPRDKRLENTSSEFLVDPQTVYGKHFQPHVLTLSEITPDSGLLVLCGEPGLGKTTEIEQLHANLTVTLAEDKKLIHLKARDFGSLPDLEGYLEKQPAWHFWRSGSHHLTILLDGVDEGLIRMPELIARLSKFLENKPTNQLRFVLSCRSFEWPEAEGVQLASLWKQEERTCFIFELEPLRQQDARLAAKMRGYDGDKFLQAVHRADVASLASRPITLFFLLDEFSGDDFQVTSRRQLYKNGCRRLCDENKINPDRARFVRQLSREQFSADEKVAAAGKLACGMLLGGYYSLIYSTSSISAVSKGNTYNITTLIDSGLLFEGVVEQTLGAGLFTAFGGDCFGFFHQTCAECLAGQTLAQLPLAQLRTLLCATDPASGNEYVIPQLFELAAWVAGDHSDFFSFLIEVDPSALLRGGVASAEPAQKKKLVERIFDQAQKNQFFGESGYWRFWRDLNYPELPDQLIAALDTPDCHVMVKTIAIDIAKACQLPELVPKLLDILSSEMGDFRSAIADALCAAMPDDRLAELEPLVRGEVGPDPDQSILAHALVRLVPKYWSVSDALPFIKRDIDGNFFGSYWRFLNDLHQHLTDNDILVGLRIIGKWDGGFAQGSFTRNFCMSLLSRALAKIDDPEVCDALVELWITKAKNFQDFFRAGDSEDSDFVFMNEDSRRKWIAAIIHKCTSISNDEMGSLWLDVRGLIKHEDFIWLLENLLRVAETAAPLWAKLIQRLFRYEEVRTSYWDEFIQAYRRSPTLRSEMSWFENTALGTPDRRKTKAEWLLYERRYAMQMLRRSQREKRHDPKIEIERTLAQIESGESWEFINLCWALSLNEQGQRLNHLRHDITAYPGWLTISVEQKDLVRLAAVTFLLERSDGWKELSARTNYFDPGVVAIWLLRNKIIATESLRMAVATKWVEAIIQCSDPGSDHAKELFTLAYRINPELTIDGWIRQIRRDSEQHGHPFAIRRAEACFDETLSKELIELLKNLKDPKSVRMTIYELTELNKGLASEIATYLLERELRPKRIDEKLVGSLIIAGIGADSRGIWRLAYMVLQSRPQLAKRIMLSIAEDADIRGSNVSNDFREDEICDFYLLLYRLFPHSEEPEDAAGLVTPRRSIVALRNMLLNALCVRNTLAACYQLNRLAEFFPTKATWLLYRSLQTLSAVRRNNWQPFTLPDIAAILLDARKRLLRDNSDLKYLVMESLQSLQRHLNDTTLPAVEDLWQWEDAGLRRKNFRHKDEEAVSDYIARWLRDKIGTQSEVFVNREVQPRRGKRTDIVVEAWGRSSRDKTARKVHLSVTIEVKGCWNTEVRTGAKDQLFDQYLRPFGLTHGIFLVAWFYSPGFAKLAQGQSSVLEYECRLDANEMVAQFVDHAKAPGYDIAPFVLDCRLS